MSTELHTPNESQRLYVHALASAYRGGVQLYDPSVWLGREPELEEKMLRDADIAHAVGYRRHLIAGQRWSCTARYEGSVKAPLAVAVGTDLLREIKQFTGARLNLARAFLSGQRYAMIQGRVKTLTIGDGRPRKWWVPVRLKDEDKRIYRTVSKLDVEGRISAHREKWNINSMTFEPLSSLDAIAIIRHTYQDDEGSLGYGRGLRDPLAWWWYAKTQVFNEKLSAVERFAQGILSAKVDGARHADSGLPNTELITSWRRVLEDLRARHVLVYDKSDQVEHVSMNGEGWQLLDGITRELKNTIFTLVLGANLTTSADEGGSYALAGVQENSTEALVQFDREALEETLSDDLLGYLWFRNHANLVELGLVDEQPRFSITQEKREDPRERADVAEKLHNMGVDVPLDDLYEQTGFRKPDVGEPTLAGREAPDPFGAGLGAPPFGVPRFHKDPRE